MASKQDQSAASWDTLKCSVCKDDFKTPKYLPCIHTFCLECLEKYGEDERPGDKMPCPLCRQLFKIPAEGFKKLPNNIFIKQITATAKLFTSLAGSGVKCEGCDKTNATHYCVDCAESVWDAWSGVHRKQKISCAHKVVSLSEKEGSQVYTRACPTFCDAHKDNQLKLYCYDCSRVICLLCSEMDLRNHLCADIQTLSSKFCDELISCCPHLEECTEMNAIEQKSMDKQKSNLLEQISACERAVHERGEQLKRIVDEQCREVLSQLEKVKDDRIKIFQARKEEVDHQSLMLSSLRAYMEELVEKRAACAILQSAKDLLARAKQLHADQVKFSTGSLSPDRVGFEPANGADITSGRMALIGSLSVNASSITADLGAIISGMLLENEIKSAKAELQKVLEFKQAALSVHGARMVRVRQQLVDCLRRTDVILTVLLLKQYLTHKEYQQIKSQSCTYMIVQHLIDVIIEKSEAAFTCFLDALKATQQEDLYRLLMEDGFQLDLGHRTVLKCKYKELIENIKVTPTLLSCLLQYEVLQFNAEEVDTIRSKPTQYEKINELLSILLRSSAKQYATFFSLLPEAGHQHVQELLTDSSPRVPQVRPSMTYQRSTKGPISISMDSADGKFVALENTGRREENLDGLKIRRNIDSIDKAKFPLDYIVVQPMEKIKIWAAGCRPPKAPPTDLEYHDNWGTGSAIKTR